MTREITRAVACLGLMLTYGTTSAQQKAPLRFEVASIKLNKSGVFGSGGTCRGADRKPGVTARVTVPLGHCKFVNIPVENLIHLAYRAEITPGSVPPPLIGLPDWAKAERFNVEAKAEDLTVTQAELFEMLRTVLSERFQLQFHRVTKEVSGYRLIVDKGGHKLVTSKPDEPRAFAGQGPRGQAISRNFPLDGLVSFLRSEMDSPINNATGLNGNYDFHLTFDPGSAGRQFNTGPASVIPGRASLFTALQEQLGLKLEKTRLPVVTYVVGRIQRPSPN
jgi:uncharacterized protein (TIGR03435 family)